MYAISTSDDVRLMDIIFYGYVGYNIERRLALIWLMTLYKKNMARFNELSNSN